MQEVVAALERAIRDGEYAPHSRLPSERDIVKRFRVTRRAAQAAIEALEARGIVYRIERGGTFVGGAPERPAAPPESVPLKCINFVEPVRRRADPFAFALTDYLHGYTRALQNHSLRVRFTAISVDETQFDAVLNPALPLDGQGCVIGDLRSPGLMQWLSAQGIPYVIRRFAFYDARHLPKHHGVYLNRNGAMHRATISLMELGHRRIGYVGQVSDEATRSPNSLDFCSCYEGYRSAFTVAGRAIEPDHLVDVLGGDIEEVYELVLRLLQLPDRPTALVCQNDLTAFGVMKAARKLGLRLPEELSVTGFDNDPAGAECDPTLTTFKGHEELAMAALTKLFAVASGKPVEYGAEPIECPLVRRRSVAPPAQSARIENP